MFSVSRSMGWPFARILLWSWQMTKWRAKKLGRLRTSGKTPRRSSQRQRATAQRENSNMIAEDQPEAGQRAPGDAIHLDTATRATMSLAAQMGLFEKLVVELGVDRAIDPFSDARYQGYCTQLEVATKKRATRRATPRPEPYAGRPSYSSIAHDQACRNS